MKTKDITLIGMMIAIIEVCKVVMAGIPNVELTSFWIIVFCVCFGKKMFCTIPAFILIEGLMYGFGLWWVQYLIAWPVLGIVAAGFRKMDSPFGWAMISGIFGLFFGALCAIPYLFMGGLKTAVAWWIAGIPYDLIHGVSNFIIMMIFFRPMKMIMNKVCRMI